MVYVTPYSPQVPYYLIHIRRTQVTRVKNEGIRMCNLNRADPANGWCEAMVSGRIRDNTERVGCGERGKGEQENNCGWKLEAMVKEAVVVRHWSTRKSLVHHCQLSDCLNPLA